MISGKGKLTWRFKIFVTCSFSSIQCGSCQSCYINNQAKIAAFQFKHNGITLKTLVLHMMDIYNNTDLVLLSHTLFNTNSSTFLNMC